MKKNNIKKGSVSGTALSSVVSIILGGTIIVGSYFYMEQGEELDKANSNIVQNEKSLKHQENKISGLDKEVEILTQAKMDMKSKNDNLLKDNAKLNQKLKGEEEKNSQLKQKLKQTESQVIDLKK